MGGWEGGRWVHWCIVEGGKNLGGWVGGGGGGGEGRGGGGGGGGGEVEGMGKWAATLVVRYLMGCILRGAGRCLRFVILAGLVRRVVVVAVVVVVIPAVGRMFVERATGIVGYQ